MEAELCGMLSHEPANAAVVCSLIQLKGTEDGSGRRREVRHNASKTYVERLSGHFSKVKGLSDHFLW